MYVALHGSILSLYEFTGDTVLDKLRDRVISYLSQNHVCVIATSGSFGAWQVTAPYKNNELELNCHLPRWSDVIYHIEQESHVMVIIMEPCPNSSSWLQYRGVARVTDSMDDRYVSVNITPERIDLIEESRGWGARETLEL